MVNAFFAMAKAVWGPAINMCMPPDHCAGLIVFADWYDLETMKGVRFYDDNTRSWWEAATGGRQGMMGNEG